METPKIKICGLTTVAEAQWVVQESVDYAGVVLFYPKSRRNRTIEQARELLAVIHDGREQMCGAAVGSQVQAVAVTVSPTKEQVEAIQAAGFDMLQVHGELSEEVYDAVRIPIIRAFNGTDSEAYEKARDSSRIEAYLFDAKEPGSGETFDWNSLRKIPRDGRLIFLAGGLNAANVEQAIRIAEPDVVDVSSGVEKEAAEAAPGGSEKDRGTVSGGAKKNGERGICKGGGKDREKIKEFVRRVRACGISEKNTEAKQTQER